MARIAIILPHEHLAGVVQQLIQRMNVEQAIIIEYDNDYTKIYALVEHAQQQGAEIILARGLVAAWIRQCSDIPVVEMRITAQELGLFIQKAKSMSKNQPPTIALVGTHNMFCDFSRMSELFNVSLCPYLISPNDQDPLTSMESQTLQAIDDGVDVIIGGNTACSVAKTAGVPSVYSSATSDSIKESLRIARRVSYAIDQEKTIISEIQAMLDSSSSILIRFDRKGHITNVNRAATIRLKQSSHEICGNPLLSLIKGISQQQLQQTLFTGKEHTSVFIAIGAEQFIANILPIRTSDGNIIGGVLSCDGVSRIENASIDIRMERRRQAHSSNHTFADLAFQSEALKKFQRMAEAFSRSDSPIQLQCAAGGHPQIIAECIHNASNRSEMTFVSVNCSELSPDEQLRVIFGSDQPEYAFSRSMCAVAHMGTLYLQNPEYLSFQSQSCLFHLITQSRIFNTRDYKSYPLNVRVITSTELTNAQQEPFFRNNQNLLILLRSLQLHIPSLNHSADHIEGVAAHYLKHYQKKYQRHLSITEGGWRWFREHDWPGNYLQIEHFCERIVLAAPRKSVNELLLEQLYSDLPATSSPIQSTPATQTLYPEAQLIKEALVRNRGKRSSTAHELGISTSTLWRKINKYKITLSDSIYT